MASKAFPRIVIAVLLLIPALPALAGSSTTAYTWRAALKEVDQKLRAQQWEAAGKQARKVARLIVEGAGTGEGASYSLAVVSAFQAIAEAGQGHEDAADWYWATALNLFPEIAKTDLKPYGPAAAGLRARQVRFTNTDSQSPASPEDGIALKKPEGEVEPPKVLRQVSPKFPDGLRRLGIAAAIKVEAIIGEDGVPRHPLVLTLGNAVPAMKYVVLDSLREWRFEPARLEDKPVKVYYVLTVNFGYRG
ncbi:MAG TPA: energy transducer TonB [Thermoanaerobaculia bacterium]|jgi:hypothetical protein|nr:energy transducer TonB [Thermoanaerobaculia bacterium]